MHRKPGWGDPVRPMMPSQSYDGTERLQPEFVSRKILQNHKEHNSKKGKAEG